MPISKKNNCSFNKVSGFLDDNDAWISARLNDYFSCGGAILGIISVNGFLVRTLDRRCEIGGNGAALRRYPLGGIVGNPGFTWV